MIIFILVLNKTIDYYKHQEYIWYLIAAEILFVDAVVISIVAQPFLRWFLS